jgi:hypothetical protein
VDEVTHKKLVALNRFMDKMRYATWSGTRDNYGAFARRSAPSTVLLDATTSQDIRGESRGVPDRGHRRRRPGEDAHRGEGRGLGAVH